MIRYLRAWLWFNILLHLPSSTMKVMAAFNEKEAARADWHNARLARKLGGCDGQP